MLVDMPPILIYQGILRFIQASAGESCGASSGAWHCQSFALLWLDCLTVPFAVSFFVPFSSYSHFFPLFSFLIDRSMLFNPWPPKKICTICCSVRRVGSETRGPASHCGMYKRIQACLTRASSSEEATDESPESPAR